MCKHTDVCIGLALMFGTLWISKDKIKGKTKGLHREVLKTGVLHMELCVKILSTGKMKRKKIVSTTLLIFENAFAEISAFQTIFGEDFDYSLVSTKHKVSI